MTHGTFATWHVAEGDRVAQGAPLFDIETEKAAMEVEAPVAGHLHHIAAQPGDRIAVGTTIAWLYAEGEEVGPPPSVAAARPDATVPPAAPVGAPPQQIEPSHTTELPPEPQSTGVAAAIRATPAARAAARAEGLPLEDIPGTGPRGRIQKDDVVGLPDSNRPETVAAASRWQAEPGALHVTRRPGTGMPILLIHGFAADSQSWAPLEKTLGTNRPVIRVDLPGHGKSPRRKLASFQALARTMVETFDEVVGTERVHLVGHSLGGALALAISDIRPRKIASLTMIAPAGLGPEIDADALNGLARASRVESLAPWLRRLTSTPAAISDDYARAAFRSRSAPAMRSYQLDLGDVLFPDGVQAFDLRPALRRLELPAQIIWGRDDRILPLRQAISAGGEIGLFLIDAAGHIPQFERPDRVARIVSQLIAGVEALD